VWYENLVTGEIKYMGVWDSKNIVFTSKSYFWDWVMSQMRNEFARGNQETYYEISRGPISQLPVLIP